MHFPPFNNIERLDMNYLATMRKYKVKECIYGHLHGEVCKEAFEGEKFGINFKLVSCDYTSFKLIKIV